MSLFLYIVRATDGDVLVSATPEEIDRIPAHQCHEVFQIGRSGGGMVRGTLGTVRLQPGVAENLRLFRSGRI